MCNHLHVSRLMHDYTICLTIACDQAGVETSMHGGHAYPGQSSSATATPIARGQADASVTKHAILLLLLFNCLHMSGRLEWMSLSMVDMPTQAWRKCTMWSFSTLMTMP